MRMRASIPLFLPLLLIACANETIVEVPVLVEVPVTQWREIPPELTRQQSKTTIPDALTYGEALEAWSRDRAAVDKLNGQLLGIKSLSREGSDDGS